VSVKRPASQAGFLMIEVLITMFILLIGLLGVVGLQARSQQAENESYQRSQALVLLRDMADRINANRKNAASYVTATTVGGAMGIGNTSLTDCGAPTTPVHADLCQWSHALAGAAESSGGTCDPTSGDHCAGTMINARGCITNIAAATYMIQVVWQGLAPTDAPPASVDCASGQYGVEEQRRAVTTVIQIADLSK
jgi:type IV pilus assembly protein PilV